MNGANNSLNLLYKYSTYINETLKVSIKLKKLTEIFGELWTKFLIERQISTDKFRRFWIVLYIVYELLHTTVLQLNLFKICMKHLDRNLQKSVKHPKSFVWPCRKVINAILTILSWLHVFKHVKNVCSFYYT